MMAGCAGLTLGIAVLTRANLAPFALFAPMWLAVPAQGQALPRRQGLWAALICMAVLALTVSPWLVRSFRYAGSVTLSTQNSFFLWMGNNPYTFSYYPYESIDRSQRAAFEALTPQEIAQIRAPSAASRGAAAEDFFSKRAMDYVREHPWRTFGGGLRKIGAAFGWLPSPRRDFWVNSVHALSYGPVMTLGLWGLWAGRRHWREHLIFYALFVSFAAVTAVFFGHTNYRTYLDLYLIVFAAGVLEQLQTRYSIAPPRAWQHAATPRAVAAGSDRGTAATLAGARPARQSGWSADCSVRRANSASCD
jgi:hypothetical protein